MSGATLARPGHATRPGAGLGTALRPLLIDIGVPVGGYYLLHGAFGLSVWLSLALSSVGPAVRATAGLAAERKLNVLALLMLAVNLAGIAVSFLTGDPRAMIAKDSLVSSVIAVAILASVAARRPLMSAGLRPFLTKGVPERAAAWDRLSACSARFRRLEMLFSAIWGLLLLADCAARLIGAYTLPVTTMVWLTTVLTLGAVSLGVMTGGVAARPIEKMVEAEAARLRRLGPGGAPHQPGGDGQQDDRRYLDDQHRVRQARGERELESEDADRARQQEAHDRARHQQHAGEHHDQAPGDQERDREHQGRGHLDQEQLIERLHVPVGDIPQVQVDEAGRDQQPRVAQVQDPQAQRGTLPAGGGSPLVGGGHCFDTSLLSE
jgi:hypothetical protein